MTLDELNALPRAAFVEKLGWIFEHSPWVTERAWDQRPFASLDALHAATSAEVERATRDEQLALLRAHPDLGARAKLSAASEQEQAGAGLDRLSPDQLARLMQLNAAYREKFGFPFLFAVKRSTWKDIFVALTERTDNTLDLEFRTALEQVYKIARFRLEGLIS